MSYAIIRNEKQKSANVLSNILNGQKNIPTFNIFFTV